MAVEILELDDSEALRRGYNGVVNVCKAETQPEFRATTYEELVAAIEGGDPGYEGVRLVAVDGSDVVGMGWARVPLLANRGKAFVWVGVLPPYRRHGIGRALASALELAIPAERSELIAWLRLGVNGSLDSRAAAAALGYDVVETLLPSALVLRPGLGIVRSDSGQTTTRYRLTTFEGVADSQLRPGLARLRGQVAADATRGKLRFEVYPESPEEYLRAVQAVYARGHSLLTTVALADDGDVVAFTELEMPASAEDDVVQQGTLVHREHRGHGLGFSIKAANQQALLGLSLGHRRITTVTNDDNRWMLAVNERLGYRVVGQTLGLLKRR